MINRRGFLAGCGVALSVVVLPQFSDRESVVPLVEELPQTIVKINGVVFENAVAKEVFEHDDYYLHVEIPGSNYVYLAKIDRGLQHSYTKIVSGKHYVEVVRQNVGLKNMYTCAYTGFCHYAPARPAKHDITLFFQLESSAASLIARPKTCLFIDYHMLRANKLWWSQGDK